MLVIIVVSASKDEEVNQQRIMNNGTANIKRYQSAVRT